ncbi:hypothetical protein Tco_0305479 [Tanacetum coccineum]
MERFTRLASFVGATAGDAQRQAKTFRGGAKEGQATKRRDSVVMTKSVSRVYGVVEDPRSVEHRRSRQDRGYDSKRQDFQGQDQRFASRNGNDRQGQGNYNQRQHRSQSTRDFNQGHASGSAGQRRSTETLPRSTLVLPGEAHPVFVIRLLGDFYLVGSTST